MDEHDWPVEPSDDAHGDVRTADDLGLDDVPLTRAERRQLREAQEREQARQAREGRRRAREERRTTSSRRDAAAGRHARVAEEEDVDGPLMTEDGQYITRRTLRERRRAARERIGPTYVLREIAVVVTLALALSFVLKTWVVQPFFIPSGSMEDTLQVGDRVLVSKLTPTPIGLQRGDIVVFEDPGHWLKDSVEVKRTQQGNIVHDALVFLGLAPNDSDNHLIKRVIGMPGDHVKCCTAQGYVTVNGAVVKEPYLKQGNAPSNEPFDIRVPDGKLWVMGDHRADSGDSRFHPLGGDGSQGSVPISKVVGRAVAVAWPINRVTWLSRPSGTFADVPPPEAPKSALAPWRPLFARPDE